ncbi:MAG: hypothetical protein NWR72_01850 [Bacteroidia bacterium]|nr:hypothetical protein [Bacteroidia bacterium]
MPSLFLINPGAGKRKDLVALQDQIRTIYDQGKREAIIKLIDFQRLDEDLAWAEAQGIRRIFAVGGDGTVNAIGSRLIGSSQHFGVIPKGSGNGYARNIGFSIKTKLAIRQSLNAKTILVDTGKFAGHPFLNVAGVGLDAEVSRIFAQNGRRGFRPYAQSTFNAILHLTPSTYQVEIDGVHHRFGESFGIAIANGAQWGYDAKVSKNASITDGRFDIMVVRKFSVLEAGILVSRMFNGTLAKDRNVSIYRGSHIIIEREEAGAIQIDGEPMEAGKLIEVSLHPQSLHLLLPNTLTYERINRL